MYLSFASGLDKGFWEIKRFLSVGYFFKTAYGEKRGYMMKKVKILLSAYNGERYIEEQLQSLFDQTYPDIEIYVRDDGSVDGTLQILRKYAGKGQITLYEGENVGYRKSFHWLLAHCGDAEYISFCDQDDIWFPDKIEVSVKGLQGLDGCPAVYMTDFYWCDEEAEPLRENNAYKRRHGLQKYIARGDLEEFGFTMVMNRRVFLAIRDKDCTAYCAHDEVVYQYCLCNGKVIFGQRPEAYYRRHGDNASPQELVGGNYFSHFMWRIREFLLQDRRDEIYQQAEEFLQCFWEELPQEKREIYQFYLEKGHRFKKAVWRGRYRDTLLDEFCIRVM